MCVVKTICVSLRDFGLSYTTLIAQVPGHPVKFNL